MKTKYLRWILFTGGWLILASSGAQAASGKITYQGQLRESGVPVTASRDMIFRVYTASTGGSAVWSSGTQSVSVVSGLFRVALQPTGVNWESTIYMEVTVDGTTLSPREELTASPYAVNSSQLSGKLYTTSTGAPSSPSAGDLWFDTGPDTLSVWSGTAWDQLSSGLGAGNIAVSNGGTVIEAAAAQVDFSTNNFRVTAAGGGVASVALSLSSVTLQGNTFNATNQLVKLSTGGALTVNGWVDVSAILSAQKTVSLGASTAGQCATDTLGVPGARVSDVVWLGLPVSIATADPEQVITGYVSSNDVVTVRRCNACSVVALCTALSATSGLVRVDVIRH